MTVDRKELRLGVIGLSEGNGHPYSWSAIFNGYDPEYMKDCPFPVIPQYLSERSFPSDTIKGATVTHIWTQDEAVSHHIAKASKIQTVCQKMEDMIGQIDAVLLARDDAENHLAMSTPFLSAGLPIFIDKPLALNVKEAKEIMEMQQHEDQLFSCTALRFASEFELSQSQKENLGELVSIKAVAPKSWEKYAVHVIEPAYTLLSPEDMPLRVNQVLRKDDQVHMKLQTQKGIPVDFVTTGSQPSTLHIEIEGSKSTTKLIFEDAFSAFRSSLQYFIDLVGGKVKNIPIQQTLEIVQLIEQGIK